MRGLRHGVEVQISPTCRPCDLNLPLNDNRSSHHHDYAYKRRGRSRPPKLRIHPSAIRALEDAFQGYDQPDDSANGRQRAGVGCCHRLGPAFYYPPIQHKLCYLPTGSYFLLFPIALFRVSIPFQGVSFVLNTSRCKPVSLVSVLLPSHRGARPHGGPSHHLVSSSLQ